MRPESVLANGASCWIRPRQAATCTFMWVCVSTRELGVWLQFAARWRDLRCPSQGKEGKKQARVVYSVRGTEYREQIGTLMLPKAGFDRWEGTLTVSGGSVTISIHQSRVCHWTSSVLGREIGSFVLCREWNTPSLRTCTCQGTSCLVTPSLLEYCQPTA